MRKKIIRLSTILTILLGMIFIFGVGFYSLSSVTDANLTVKEASGKAGTTNNLVSIEVTSNVDVRGIQFTLKDDPDVLTPTTVSLNPSVSGVSIDKQDHPGEGLIVVIKSDSDVIIPAGGSKRIDILYDVKDSTPEMKVNLNLIDVNLADNSLYINPITTTVSNSYFSIRSPETIPPTISGPYTGSCMYSELVDGMSFASNVEMWWSHSDNSGGSGIDINSVRVWYIDPQGIHDLPYSLTTPDGLDGGSFIFPASSLNIQGWYTINIKVCDRDKNCTETTAKVYVPTSDTCKPTIYNGPSYYVAGCSGSSGCHGSYLPVNGVTFTKDVTIKWWHSDNSEGLCRDTGIDTTKVTAECKISTSPDNDYVPLTLNSGDLSGGGSFVFPVSFCYGTSYTIKISVSDKVGNTQITTATVYVNKPPSKPTITFSKNPVKCGESFTVTASSTDPNGDYITYSWAWQYPGQSGPGQSWPGGATLGPMSVSTPGVHTVYCKTVDIYGASSPTGSATLTVVCPTITLFTPEINGKSVTINGVATPSSGATITRINWIWGDGTSGDQWFPASHTYSTSGTYAVTATAYDSAGKSASASESVTIQ